MISYHYVGEYSDLFKSVVRSACHQYKLIGKIFHRWTACGTTTVTLTTSGTSPNNNSNNTTTRYRTVRTRWTWVTGPRNIVAPVLTLPIHPPSVPIKGTLRPQWTPKLSVVIQRTVLCAPAVLKTNCKCKKTQVSVLWI